MKVICPECSAEFEVPVEELGPHGRRVRCANCAHIWLQEPEAEKPFGSFRRFDDDLAVEPIPPSLHPDSDDDDDDEDKGPGFFSTLNYPYLGKMLAGFGLVFLVCAGTLAVLGGVDMAPRAFAGVLGAMGVKQSAHEKPFKVESLAVRAAADKEGGAVTLVTGVVVNTGTHSLESPQLEVVPVEADGTQAEGVRVKLDDKEIEGGKSASFGAQLRGNPPAGGKIIVKVLP